MELFIKIQYDGEEEIAPEKIANALLEVLPGRMKKQNIQEIKIRNKLDALKNK